jgi:predicted ATPase
MQLVDVRIHGFRRFGGDRPHKVLLDAKLTCIIGANEAGKSSVLQLLAGGHADSAVASTDRTRREAISDDRLILRMRYRLDDKDRVLVADEYSARGAPNWLIVEKTAGGNRRYELEPPPSRDRTARAAARTALVAAIEAKKTGDEALADLNPDELLSLADDLADDVETVDSEVLQHADGVGNALEIMGLQDACDAVREAATQERLEHPHDIARRLLWFTSPDFIAFDAAERELATEYDLVKAAPAPPPALRNLAALADLNLSELLESIATGETGTTQHLIELANAKLREAFAVWTQTPPVRVSFDTNASILVIHVASGSDTPMRFEERSDGLRQFVALVAATARRDHDVPPILLIDELETHLHYDAQADLVRVLSEQDAVKQIIYTTHSAACLPDDLGSVRVIEPDPERTRSKVRQHFWTDQPGLGPLLMALGAATLAFVPRRPALIAEGPSDLILLPTLLCQALDVDHVGYQVAPGGSEVRPGAIIGLELEARHTAWIVDGDGGGEAIRAKLIEDGISEDAIIVLGGEGSGVALEDLIDRAVYVDAINAYLSDVSATSRISASDLHDGRLNTDVEAWCTRGGVEAPSKVAVANRVLSMRADQRLVAEDRVEVVKAVHTAARKRLT